MKSPQHSRWLYCFIEGRQELAMRLLPVHHCLQFQVKTFFILDVCSCSWLFLRHCPHFSSLITVVEGSQVTPCRTMACFACKQFLMEFACNLSYNFYCIDLRNSFLYRQKNVAKVISHALILTQDQTLLQCFHRWVSGNNSKMWLQTEAPFTPSRHRLPCRRQWCHRDVINIHSRSCVIYDVTATHSPNPTPHSTWPTLSAWSSWQHISRVTWRCFFPWIGQA